MRVTKKMLEEQVKEAQEKRKIFKDLMRDQLGACTEGAEKHKTAMNMNKGGISLLEYMIEQFDAPLPDPEKE